MTPFNNLRMELKAALDNLWSRIRSQITGLDNRVDDLEGDMIKSISLNGVNVPIDAQGNVALQETDPTVPAWAKQVKAKTSDFTNDGDGSDNNSPFATQKYVQDNGGKIDVVKVNGTALPIVSKQVDVPVPTKTSDLINDSGFSEDGVIDMEYGGEYINDLYPYLNEKIRPGEPRRFKASILQIGILTNNQVHWDVWGYIYRYDDGDDIEYTMICYDEYSTYACYYARVYSNEQDWRRDIVHVLRVFQFAEAGGGGSGAIDTVTFNGITHQPDASGDVNLTETDPTVPAWAKAQTKPTYTAQEVGALPASTPIPTKTSDLTNDSGFITQESDPTVPSWAKQSSKPTYTAQEVGALPASTPIPSKTSDLTNDSGFLTSSTGVSGVKGNAETGGYRHGNVNLTPANIGAVSTSDVINVAHGGTGKTTNWEGLAALSTPRGNTTWKDAPVGVSVFKYEGDTSSFDVPGYSFVVVIKESNARGVAYAIKWADPSTALWISYLHDNSGQNNWSAWKTIVDTNGAVPVTSGGTGATTAADARTNLGITPANIGAFGGGSYRKITKITIAANSSIDVTLSVNIQNYTVLVLGVSPYDNPNREGFNGQSDIYFFPRAMSASNQYSYIVPPNNSWLAWFPSPTSLHVFNGTSNEMIFRIDGIN